MAQEVGTGYTLTATGDTVSTAPGGVLSEPFDILVNLPAASFRGGSFDGWDGSATVAPTLAGPHILLTHEVTGVTATSAWLHGTLEEAGAVTSTVAWAHWGLEDGGTNASAWAFTYAFGTNSEPTPRAYSNHVTGLTPDRYYFSSYHATTLRDGEELTYWTRPPRAFVTGEVRIEATDPDASEAGPDTGTFTVTRPVTATNGPLTVYYTVGGTASNGVDYAWLGGSVVLSAGASSATITVTPLRDRLRDEGDETVTLTLAPGGYLIGAPNSAAVTIADDPEGGLVRVDTDAPGPAEDGRTWATAYRTLALALAQEPTADEFWVAEGTYTPGASAGDTFLWGPTRRSTAGSPARRRGTGRWTAHETVLSGDLGGGIFAQHALTKGTGGGAVRSLGTLAFSQVDGNAAGRLAARSRSRRRRHHRRKRLSREPLRQRGRLRLGR